MFFVDGSGLSDAAPNQNYYAYCIEMGRADNVAGVQQTSGVIRSFTDVYSSGDFSRANGNSLTPEKYEKVNWIVHNGFPLVRDFSVAPRANDREKATATAAAIYLYTDNATPTNLNNNERAIYDYLTGPANVGMKEDATTGLTGEIFYFEDGQTKVIVDNTPEANNPHPSTEPSSEESTSEQPSSEESTPEESTSEQPSSEESTSEETTSEQPSSEESVTTEPSEEPSESSEESTSEQPSSEESTEPTVPVPGVSTEPTTTVTTSERPGAKPEIRTSAEFKDGSQVVQNGATVVDTVHYTDLVAGKNYTLNAKLVDKQDADNVLGTGAVTFEAPGDAGDLVSGSVKVEIAVTDAENPVQAAVAFERLTSTEVNAAGEETDGKTNDIAEHEDIDDEDQTVRTVFEPSIATNAKFGDGSTQVVAGSTVIDTVDYEGLVPGKEYTLSAKLMERTGDEAPYTEGRVLGEGTATFTPETTDGSVEVAITVNDDVTEPVPAAVAFEELTSTEVDQKGQDNPKGGNTPETSDDNEIAEHKDIDDAAQTVEGSVTTESSEPSEPSESSEESTSEQPSSEESTSEQPSSEESTEPTVPVPGDSEETVTTTVTTSEQPATEPRIATNAKFGDGSTQVVAGSTVIDTVDYEGLVPGKEYTLSAKLMERIGDEAPYTEGRVLGEGTKTFTPESTDGSVEVTITVNDDVTEPVAAAVAFEELTSTEVDRGGNDNQQGGNTPGDFSDDNEIAEHKDIDDAAQTVEGSESTEPSESSEPSESTTTVTTTSEEPSAEESTPTTTPMVPGEPTDESTPTTTPVEPGEPTDESTPTPTDVCEPVETTSTVPGTTNETTTRPDGTTVTTTVPETCVSTPETSEETTPAPVPSESTSETTAPSTDTPAPSTGGTPDNGSSVDKGKLKWLLLIPGLGLIPALLGGGGGSSMPAPQPGPAKPAPAPAPSAPAGQTPKPAGQPVPADSPRGEIKQIPSGGTVLEADMPAYI